MNVFRRQLIKDMAATGLLSLMPLSTWASASSLVTNDVSQLNPVPVADVRQPRTTDAVRVALRDWFGPVSVGGGRFSMGGQIAARNSLHLDMRRMNQVVFFDAARRVIRVQAGSTWRDIQDVIDPHDLSVRIMQSYSNFTVGGSASVNCHGRYVGRGPLINSVRAVQLVTAAGEVLELSRTQHAQLFAAAFGGYGGLGVITEVELELDANTAIERIVQNVSLVDYPAFFHEQVLRDPAMVLHNADLTPPNFDAPRAISWRTLLLALPSGGDARAVPPGLSGSQDVCGVETALGSE